MEQTIYDRISFPRAPVRIAALGDSITTNNVTPGAPGGTGGFPRAASYSMGPEHITAGAAYLAGRALLTGVYGFPGISIATIQQTYLPQLLASKPRPGRCVLLSGTNDLGLISTAGKVPGSGYDATYQAVLQTLRQNSIEPIIGTLPPANNGIASQDKAIRQINQWLRAVGRESGMQVLDFFDVLVDPVTGGYKAGYNVDALHPSAKGHWAMAQEYGKLTLPYGRPYLTGDTADAMNLLANGVFLGAGPEATSWGVASAGAGFTDSIITGDPTIVGNWQQLLSTQASTRTLYQQVNAGAGTFAVGDTLAMAALVSTSGCELGGCGPVLQANCLPGPTSTVAACAGTNQNWAFDMQRALMYIEFTVPAATTYLQFYLSAGGGPGIVRFAQATLINLTANGLDTVVGLN